MQGILHFKPIEGALVVKTRVVDGTDKGPEHAWQEPCASNAEGSHRPSVLGYLRGPRPDGFDCDRPLSVVCGLGCGATTVWRCKGHRESRCRACSARYRL